MGVYHYQCITIPNMDINGSAVLKIIHTNINILNLCSDPDLNTEIQSFHKLGLTAKGSENIAETITVSLQTYCDLDPDTEDS